MSGVVACTAAMAVVVEISRRLLAPHMALWPALLTEIAIGVVVYALLVHAARIAPYREIRAVFGGSSRSPS
ncbi:MAG: hypothetical protein ACQEXJ_18025 [Myxococcota bacterium]